MGPKVLYSVFFFGAFVIIMAIRPIGMPDTQAYADMYQKVNLHTEYGFSITRTCPQIDIEYGFLYFIKLAKALKISFRMFLAMQALFCSVLVYLSIKNINEFLESDCKINIPLFLVIYYSFFGVYYEGIAIRAGMAISLGLYSISLILLGKQFKGILCVLLSILFHRMGVINLAMAVIIKTIPLLKNKKYYFIIWLVLGGIFLSPLYRMINEWGFSMMGKALNWIGLNTFSHYLVRINSGGVGKKVIFFWLIGVIPIFWVTYSPKIHKLINWYYVSLIMIMMVSIVPLPNRIYDYGMISSVPFIYYTFTNSRSKHMSWNVKMIILFGILVMYSYLVWNVILTWRK